MKGNFDYEKLCALSIFNAWKCSAKLKANSLERNGDKWLSFVCLFLNHVIINGVYCIEKIRWHCEIINKRRSRRFPQNAFRCGNVSFSFDCNLWHNWKSRCIALFKGYLIVIHILWKIFSKELLFCNFLTREDLVERSFRRFQRNARENLRENFHCHSLENL